MKNFTLYSKLKVSILIGSMLFLPSIFAQDVGYVHTTTSTNTSGHITRLDHPDLNNNPSAHFLFSQRYIDGSGVDNNNPTGIWYDGNRWAIYNENMATLNVGVQFNIFIPDDSSVFVHTASSSNTSGLYTYLDDTAQEDYLFYNTYWNPFAVYNTSIYGNYYNSASAKRALFSENATNIPENASFKIMKGSGTSSYLNSISSSAAVITGSSMRLDIPTLNGNPDAVFLYSHYWGIPTGSNQGYLPVVSEAFYSGGYWHIYAYSTANFPTEVLFDIIIPETVLGVEDVDASLSKISIYPNPATDFINFQSKAMIEEIQVFNLSGQMVLTSKQTGNSIQVNIANLPSGIYLAKIKSAQGWSSQKLIKQ